MQFLLSNVLASVQILAAHNIFSAYFFVYISGVFLGNIAAFTALWLAFHGVFNGTHGLLLVLLTLFIADITADFLWYSLGRSLSDTRLGNFIESHLPHAEKIQRYLHKNSTKLVFLSKFLYFSNFPILFSVGWAKVEFKKYFRTSLLAVAVWIPFVLLTAYVLFSSLSLIVTTTLIKKFELVFLIGLGVFLLFNYGVSYLVAKFFD